MLLLHLRKVHLARGEKFQALIKSLKRAAYKFLQ